MKRRVVFSLIVPFLLILSLTVIPVTAQEASNADMDSDGLPDTWEASYVKGDLTAMSKDSDYDNDGISDSVEYELGTNPTIPDSRGPRIEYQYDKLGRIVHIKRIPSSTP